MNTEQPALHLSLSVIIFKKTGCWKHIWLKDYKAHSADQCAGIYFINGKNGIHVRSPALAFQLVWAGSGTQNGDWAEIILSLYKNILMASHNSGCSAGNSHRLVHNSYILTAPQHVSQVKNIKISVHLYIQIRLQKIAHCYGLFTNCITVWHLIYCHFKSTSQHLGVNKYTSIQRYWIPESVKWTS